MLLPDLGSAVQEVCGFGGVSPVKVAGTGAPVIPRETERDGAIYLEEEKGDHLGVILSVCTNIRWQKI